MSQGLAPDVFKDEEKYNSVRSAVDNIIYDPETGESRKTRSVPIERMISLDPDVVKRIPDLIREIEEREKSGEGTVSGEFFQHGGNVVKDDDPLQIDMRMRNPSVYAGSKISPFWGDTVAVPDAWMQPATEQMPTPEQQEAQHAKLLEQLNKIRIEQLIEKLKEEEIFNPQSLDYNGGGRLNIQEKTNSKGQPWSDFMQMLPYYESQQSPIPNRPPLPR